jgi:hypothetical protein
MTQVLTPEEMAALFEGLREAEGDLDSERCASPKIISPGRGLPERLGYQNPESYQTGCWRALR